MEKFLEILGVGGCQEPDLVLHSHNLHQGKSVLAVRANLAAERNMDDPIFEFDKCVERIIRYNPCIQVFFKSSA
jgi:hypothetical protein